MRAGESGSLRWRRIAVALIGLLAGAVSPAIASADWPFYGHDLANTRSAGTDGPSRAAAGTLRRFWSFTPARGDFTGTPVLSGGMLIAGSSNGGVYALDGDSGRLLWYRVVGSHINASAAIAGGVVYVPLNIDESSGTGAASVLALRLSDGTRLWQTTLDTQPGSDVFGSPVVANGIVYIGTAAGYAEGVFPDVHDRGSVVALNAATGAVVWKTYTVPGGYDGASVWSTPAIDQSTGLLYVGTGNAYHAPAADTTDAILALDAITGHIVGSFQATANDVSQGQSGLDADLGASPNLFTSSTGQPLVGEGDKAGNYWAVNREALAQVWKARVGDGGGLGGILGSTAWDGSAIYGPETLQTATWSLTADGAMRWTKIATGDSHLGSVSAANGVVYSTDYAGVLSARSATDGSLLAALPLGAPSWGGVAISGGTVYAAVGTRGGTGSVEAFRPFAPACTPRQVGATYTLVIGSRSAGNIAYALTVTNHSQTASCTLNAPVAVRLTDKRRHSLPTAARWGPERNYSILLAPGQWAQAQSRLHPDIAGHAALHQHCGPTAYSLRLTVGNGTVIAPMDPTPVCDHGQIAFQRLQVVAPSAACNARQLSLTFRRDSAPIRGRVGYTLALRNMSASSCHLDGIVGMRLLGRGASKLPTHVVAGVRSPYLLLADAQALAHAVLDTTPGQGEPSTGACERLATRLEVITHPGSGTATASIQPPLRACHKGSITLSELYPAHLVRPALPALAPPASAEPAGAPTRSALRLAPRSALAISSGLLREVGWWSR